MRPQESIIRQNPETGKEKTETPIFVEAEKLIEQMQKLTQSIGNRAYEFFESRGREIGHELEDWFRAEAEVLRPVPVELKETDTEFRVLAEVPGFQAAEIKISAEVNRLIIEGKQAEIKPETEAKAVFSERRSDRFCRKLDLPGDIDPGRVTAGLKNGVLEIILPKAPAQVPVDIEVRTV